MCHYFTARFSSHSALFAQVLNFTLPLRILRNHLSLTLRCAILMCIVCSDLLWPFFVVRCYVRGRVLCCNWLHAFAPVLKEQRKGVYMWRVFRYHTGRELGSRTKTASWVLIFGQELWHHFPHKKWSHHYPTNLALIWLYLLNLPSICSNL